jgi:WD40 repeat protein
LQAISGERPFTFLQGHTTTVAGLAFSPRGHLLISAGEDGAIRFWDTVHGRALGPPIAAHAALSSLALSRDGRVLAVGTIRGAVQLWDVGPNGVVPIAFSPDGKTLVSGGYWDGSVRFWDAARHTPVGPPLQMHTDGTSSLAFSPDGRLLAAAGEQVIQLWDVASRQPVGTPLVGHTRWVQAVAFSPDGQTLASASADHTVKLWDMSLAGWKRLACRIANRNLTRQEWTQYLGVLPYQRTCPGLPAGS